MNVSLYQAAAAMNANSRWQEAVAENLASGSSPGTRKQHIAFSAVEAGLTGVNGGHYAIPAIRTSTSFQQGTLRASGRVTDLGIEGPGFFEVQLPSGAQAFTRDGELHLTPQGQLVTKQGFPVMGDSGPVQVDMLNPNPIRVSASGEVTQGGEMKGRLHLVEFSQPDMLSGINDGYVTATNPGMIAQPATTSSIRQGCLEDSPDVSPTTEMASLMTSMRMFEINQRMMQMQDDRMGRVITELGATA